MTKLTLGLFVCLLCVAYSCANPAGRVVGGVDAYEGQFPHQISLRRNGSHTCGGSIISRTFILTAAHCIGGKASDFDIRAGSVDRFQGGVIRSVAEIIVHEDYGNFLNDVALLRLSEPLIYSQYIQPIPLATSELPSGTPVIISGWGRLVQGGDIPQRLQWNTLKAISTIECKNAIKWDSDSLICLAHEANNGACNGDSGGPAMYRGEVVGIAGFVYGGCGTANPDGYAKVFYHRDWIKKHAGI